MYHISYFFQSIGSNVIASILCQISNPRESFISWFICHLQISPLESWYSEVRDLKFNIDGHFLVLLSIRRFNCWKFEFSCHYVLSMSWELFNCPFERRLLWNITDWTNRRSEIRGLDILRNRNKYLNIISNTLLFVIWFDLH